MHYYKFNIADYRKDTMHLSALEHGIYRQLLDTYYLDEKPIKTQSVIRRLRLVSETEQNALQNVLEDFFQYDEELDCWKNTRADEEIADYHAKSEKNKANGSKGGRPKKPKKTQSVKSANRIESETKGNHKPLTINQEPFNKYFGRFWSAGLPKVKKPEAEKKFLSILKTQSDPEQFVSMLVDDIAKRIEVEQLGIDKLHPTTYLNGKRWQDEIPDPPSQNQRTASIFDLTKQNYVSGDL